MFGLTPQLTIKNFEVLSFLLLVFSIFYSLTSFLTNLNNEKMLCIIISLACFVMGVLNYLAIKRIQQQEEEKIQKNRLTTEMTHPRYS